MELETEEEEAGEQEIEEESKKGYGYSPPPAARGGGALLGLSYSSLNDSASQRDDTLASSSLGVDAGKAAAAAADMMGAEGSSSHLCT